MIDENFKVTQLCPVPGGIFAGDIQPDNTYDLSQVVALSLGENEGGQQEIRVAVLTEYGEVEVHNYISKVFMQNKPDKRIFAKL